MVRPARVAVVYDASDDWIFFAKQAVRAISQFWGGAGFILVPASRNSDVKLFGAEPLLGHYDPDYIASHSVRLGDIEKIRPSIITDTLIRNGVTGPYQETTLQNVRDIVVAPPFPDTLETMVDSWCCPFRAPFQNEQTFVSTEIIPLDSLSSLGFGVARLPIDSAEPILSLQYPTADPIVQLLLDSHFGRLPDVSMASYDAQAMGVGDDAIAPLLQVAITGSTGALSPTALRSIGGPDILQRTPFNLERQKLVKVGQGPFNRRVCIIGDTPSDHALYLICDRLFASAAWIPRTLLERRDDIGRVVRQSLRLMLAKSINCKLLLSTVSEDLEYLQSWAPSSSAEIDGAAVRLPELAKVVHLGDLVSERPGATLADRDFFDARRTGPVDASPFGFEMLAPIQAPRPAIADSEARLEWCTDIVTSRHLLPTRTAIRSARLVAHDGESRLVRVRPSRSGLTFSSQNLGFIPSGASVDGRVANPPLRFLTAFDTAKELALKVGATVDLSPAGRRALLTAERLGGFPSLYKALRSPMREVLEAFRPARSSAKNGAYANGFTIRGNGYIDFDDAKSVLSLQPGVDPRAILDSLLADEIITRGLILQCAVCALREHYSLDQLSGGFRCPHCSTINALNSRAWQSKADEPKWYYALSAPMRVLLEENGDVPILATGALSAEAHSTLWSPEFIVSYADGTQIEIDIFCIVDGRVYVGEAKSSDRLDAGKKTSNTAARRLVSIALDLGATVVVIATAKEDWSPSAVNRVEDSIDELWRVGTPRPDLLLMTSVRGHLRSETHRSDPQVRR